ncbi:MAG: ketopantoate reductase family protein [Candidatus Binataceae bacterium]
MADQRILVAGSGSLGSVYGGILARNGGRVTLLGRAAHIGAIERDGLRISGLFGEHVVRGIGVESDAARLKERFDLILFSVKAYDTTAMADALVGRLDDGGIIVSLQNGLGNLEQLISRFGAQHALGARVIFGAELERPGATRITVFAEPIAAGPALALQRNHAQALETRAAEFADLMSSAGVPTIAVADVMPVLWTKMLYNVALNPLGALLGLHYGALADDPDLRAIMNRAIDEAFAVAQAEGVTLPFADSAAYREVFYDRLVPITFDHRPSMLSDLRQRGRTEIDALNGKVVELALRHGLNADTNRLLCALIHASERRRCGGAEGK